MPRPSPGPHLQLHQPLGGEADHLAQNIRVRGLLHKRARFIISSVIGGSSVALRIATRPCRRIANDRRKPLARYGVMGSALRERLAPVALHRHPGHDQARSHNLRDDGVLAARLRRERASMAARSHLQPRAA